MENALHVGYRCALRSKAVASGSCSWQALCHVLPRRYSSVCCGLRRHIDTAMMCATLLNFLCALQPLQTAVPRGVPAYRYGNHTAVGGAIHKVLGESKVKRKGVWVTSKVRPAAADTFLL